MLSGIYFKLYTTKHGKGHLLTNTVKKSRTLMEILQTFKHFF